MINWSLELTLTRISIIFVAISYRARGLTRPGPVGAPLVGPRNLVD